MSFSATGNLLSGSIHRPDIKTFVTVQGSCGYLGSRSIPTRSMPCMLNILGYIPVVSTVTGLARALLGIVHIIVHLTCSIFNNRDHHLAEAKLGLKNIGRGLVEALPIIGNITMLIVDQVRMSKFHKMAEEQINKDKAVYNNKVVIFGCGHEIAKRPLDEFYLVL